MGWTIRIKFIVQAIVLHPHKLKHLWVFNNTGKIAFCCSHSRNKGGQFALIIGIRKARSLHPRGNENRSKPSKMFLTFLSARYFSVEGDGTHSRGASFYSAGGRLGFARASVGSIPCMLGHPGSSGRPSLLPPALPWSHRTLLTAASFSHPQQRTTVPHSSPQLSTNERSSSMGSGYCGA